MKIDAKATAKVGADFIKANKLDGFDSGVVGGLSKATEGDWNATAYYRWLWKHKNMRPTDMVSPTTGNVATGKSTTNKEDWEQTKKLAAAFCWSKDEKDFMWETRKTDDDRVKKKRAALSTRASNLATKTWHSGLVNADKFYNPEAYKRAPSAPKTILQEVTEGIDDLLKKLRNVKEQDESIFDIPETIIALEQAKKQANTKP